MRFLEKVTYLINFTTTKHWAHSAHPHRFLLWTLTHNLKLLRSRNWSIYLSIELHSIHLHVIFRSDRVPLNLNSFVFSLTKFSRVLKNRNFWIIQIIVASFLSCKRFFLSLRCFKLVHKLLRRFFMFLTVNHKSLLISKKRSSCFQRFFFHSGHLANIFEWIEVINFTILFESRWDIFNLFMAIFFVTQRRKGLVSLSWLNGLRVDVHKVWRILSTKFIKRRDDISSSSVTLLSKSFVSLKMTSRRFLDGH